MEKKPKPRLKPKIDWESTNIQNLHENIKNTFIEIESKIDEDILDAENKKRDISKLEDSNKFLTQLNWTINFYTDTKNRLEKEVALITRIKKSIRKDFKDEKEWKQIQNWLPILKLGYHKEQIEHYKERLNFLQEKYDAGSKDIKSEKFLEYKNHILSEFKKQNEEFTKYNEMANHIMNHINKVKKEIFDVLDKHLPKGGK